MPPCKKSIQLMTLKVFFKTLDYIPLLEEDEKFVSYDAKSLFTNISVKGTIDYIIDQIYTQKTLTKICTKLIFKRLLFKLATECKLFFETVLTNNMMDVQ